VRFTFGAIDLFQAEKAPIDFEASESTNLTNPQRRLIRPWAHGVKEEIDLLYALTFIHQFFPSLTSSCQLRS
jgi:hypothetical protein